MASSTTSADAPSNEGLSLPFNALKDSLKGLITALEAEQNFEQQEQMRSGKVFFMWDFVSNTARMLENLHITPDRFAAEKAEQKSDIMQRCMFADVLFNDTTGKMTLMCSGDTTEFGQHVKRASADCQQKAMQWGEAERVLG
ncbi:uncharacterized protein K452DRAFT_283614 [Aplosporella prunicola CBS 121167]|uniref:Uncharacterized protein n=1 Tax=Aplosporella prunicola CBS 121167 TaxID=1176127 RepID=A0A6A6BSU4_9PEZI|nr:uncharacterized protein K452DRAFT_283614 [Aplosporella prunicola CBS 121167]KAF2146335.1 hypothetical protein K452DRAFT_283614 [Aplosporella prunicola CBS 121167]